MKLEFDKNALEDLCYWVKTDRKQALRILKLILDILQHPFQGNRQTRSPQTRLIRLLVAAYRQRTSSHLQGRGRFYCHPILSFSLLANSNPAPKPLTFQNSLLPRNFRSHHQPSSIYRRKFRRYSQSPPMGCWESLVRSGLKPR